MSHEVGLLLLPWMHLAVVREAKPVPRRGNMSMGRRRRRRGVVVVVVERSSERLLKLGIERRGGRGVPRPVPMLHDLGRANPPNALLPASIDIRCIRCCCCYGSQRHGWLSRPGRGADGALSERLGLFGGGVMRSFRVGFERFPERLGLLRRGLGAGRAVWLGQGTRGAADGSKVVGQDFDKVGWEEADSPPISAQPARPPRPVAGVETFDQVALDKAKVAFGLFCMSTRLACVFCPRSQSVAQTGSTNLSSERVDGPTPARKPRGDAWRAQDHLFFWGGGIQKWMGS